VRAAAALDAAGHALGKGPEPGPTSGIGSSVG